MRHRSGTQDSAIVTRLFIRLLPVQVSMVAMGSINSIVDGVIAGRFIDASTVGVVGLYYTIMRILEAAGAILLGGVTVLCGKYLGSGDLKRTRGICSTGMGLALAFGTVMTLISFLMPETLAGFLGADEALKGPLTTYIKGYAIGILPQLLGQQIAAGLQLDGKDKLGQAGIIVMITVNVLLDILFVAVMKMGVWGLALATALAYWAYFLVILQHYFSKEAQIVPRASLIQPTETLPLLKIGFPNALLVACLAVRSLVINRLLVSFGGSDGLSALSSFNMISGLILSVGLGGSSLVRMLSSVFIGEGNRNALHTVFRFSMTWMLAIMAVIGAAVTLLSPTLAGLFFPDSSTEVFRMARELFFIYGFCVPLTQICLVFSGYYQAAGHTLFVNVLSVTDGFISMVVPALLLAPVLGVTGVWLSFPLGLLITLTVSVLHPVIRLRHWPRNVDEWLLLPEDFSTENKLVFQIHEMQEVTQTAEKVETFCRTQGIDRRTGAHSGLCLEEIVGSIVTHGFRMDKKKHMIEVIVATRDGNILLRIKDDCKPFNPQEWYDMTSDEDPISNVGIRLVYRIADEVEYQNMLGLNVLTIRLSDAAA